MLGDILIKEAVMALIIGDIHGRLDKAEAFLFYKPKEQHVFTGDYVDSFVQPDNIIYDTLKLVIESDAILLFGNHDIHYLSHTPFVCTGYRSHMAESLNKIFEEFIHRFVPVVVYDEFVVTHGGISKGLGDHFLRTKELQKFGFFGTIYSEWDVWLHKRDKEFDGGPIFNIPKSRGGMHDFGGIFWADYRDEQYYEIPQVFGHSKTLGGGIIEVAYKPDINHWAVGCNDNAFQCFNTVTKKVEEFGGNIPEAA